MRFLYSQNPTHAHIVHVQACLADRDRVTAVYAKFSALRHEGAFARLSPRQLETLFLPLERFINQLQATDRTMLGSFYTAAFERLERPFDALDGGLVRLMQRVYTETNLAREVNRYVGIPVVTEGLSHETAHALYENLALTALGLWGRLLLPVWGHAHYAVDEAAWPILRANWMTMLLMSGEPVIHDAIAHVKRLAAEVCHADPACADHFATLFITERLPALSVTDMPALVDYVRETLRGMHEDYRKQPPPGEEQPVTVGRSHANPLAGVLQKLFQHKGVTHGRFHAAYNAHWDSLAKPPEARGAARAGLLRTLANGDVSLRTFYTVVEGILQLHVQGIEVTVYDPAAADAAAVSYAAPGLYEPPMT